MKLTVPGIAAFAVLALVPCTARAQSLSLGVTDGLVTLDAQGVTVGEILARWTNATGAALVNADKLASAPITLQFTNIPERQALTMVLRSAGGYILVGRPDAADPVERIARVIIIAGAPGARTGGSTPPPLLSSGTTAADLNAATARAAAALEAVQSPPPQQPPLVSSAAAERTQLTPGNAYSLPPPVAVAPASTPATQPGASGARASASPSGPSRPGVVAAPPAVPDPPPVYIPSGGAEQQRQQQQQQRTP